MENNKSGYFIKIGNTTFNVCFKQSETATKSLDEVFKDMCRREVLSDFPTSDLLKSEDKPEKDLPKKSLVDDDCKI